MYQLSLVYIPVLFQVTFVIYLVHCHNNCPIPSFALQMLNNSTVHNHINRVGVTYNVLPAYPDRIIIQAHQQHRHGTRNRLVQGPSWIQTSVASETRGSRDNPCKLLLLFPIWK